MKSGIPGLTFRKRYRKNSAFDAFLALFVALCFVAIPLIVAFLSACVFIGCAVIQITYYLVTFTARNAFELIRLVTLTVYDNVAVRIRATSRNGQTPPIAAPMNPAKGLIHSGEMPQTHHAAR